MPPKHETQLASVLRSALLGGFFCLFCGLVLAVAGLVNPEAQTLPLGTTFAVLGFLFSALMLYLLFRRERISKSQIGLLPED